MTLKSVFSLGTLTILLLTTHLVSADSHLLNLKPDAWVLLPALSNSPETGFELGAYVMRIQAQKEIGTPRDRYEYLVSGTTKGMYQGYMWPRKYFNADLKLKGKVGGNYWPGIFYGIGNEYDESAVTETFESTTFESELWLQNQSLPNVWFGLGLFLAVDDLQQDTSVNVLNSGISGFEGGVYNGLGLSVNYDTRNNSDFPTQGFFLGSEYIVYDKSVASDFNFTMTNLEGYVYLPVMSDSVLALASQVSFASENTPFRKLPRPKGISILRGADSAKYIDRNMIASQLDYRMPLGNRWGADVFLDIAQVSPEPGFFTNELHHSAGIGLRFNTLKGERLNIRADIALVDNKTLGFVLYVGEAF